MFLVFINYFKKCTVSVGNIAFRKYIDLRGKNFFLDQSENPIYFQVFKHDFN